MLYIYTKPKSLLLPYVNRYWCWESSDNRIHDLPVLLPGTGVELMFHYRTPFRYSEEKNNFSISPFAYALSLRKKQIFLKPRDDVGFISVRFRVGMFRHFTHVPLGEITDPFLPVEHIWGAYGKQLAQRIFVVY